MSRSSSSNVLSSTLEEKIHMGDINSKDLPRSSPSPQELSQSDNEHAVPEDVEFSSTSSETVLKTCTNGKDDFRKTTQGDSVNSAFPERVLQVTEEVSDENPSEKVSVSKTKRDILPSEGFDTKTFPEITASSATGYIRELSQAEDFPADVESSSTEIFEKESESSTDKRDDTPKLDDGFARVNGIFETISRKETSNERTQSPLKILSISSGSPVTSHIECFDRNSFLEKNESTGFYHLSVSHETESIPKLPFLVDTSNLCDTRKASSLACDVIKMKQSTLGGIFSNGIKSSSQLNFPHFEVNSSLHTPEDKTIPNDHVSDISMAKGKWGYALHPGRRSNNRATSSYRTPIRQVSTLNLPPVSSATAISKEEPKSLEHESKPSVPLDITSNKTLTEMLSILEGWARKGLDNAFNKSMKIGSKDLKKEIQYGLERIKDMTERIYALIKAASKLPDPYTTIENGGLTTERNEIRGDIIRSGIILWHSVDDIEMEVVQDYKKLELICKNSENCHTTLEQEKSSNIVITNACTLVTERLDMLRTQLEDFREKIHVFCSEVDKLL